MQVRIVTGNPTFGYKGTLFVKENGQGVPHDHTVDPETGAALLALENSPFREVGDDGQVIPNETDKLVGQEESADRKARTITVVQDALPAPEKKTIKIESKRVKAEEPKPVADIAEIEAKEATATQETSGSDSDTTVETSEVSEDADTEGAVEV
jgi:hypothetical protein